MKTFLTFLITLSSVLLHAAAPPPTSADPPTAAVTNRPPTAATTNWQRIVFGTLSFQVPPGMTNVPVRGIDSLVGRCESTNMSLTFDYGRYSSSALREATTPIEVGGRPALILVSPLAANSYLNERARGLTNRFLLAMANGSNTLRLTIFYRDPTDLPVVRAIADSVRL